MGLERAFLGADSGVAGEGTAALGRVDDDRSGPALLPNLPVPRTLAFNISGVRGVSGNGDAQIRDWS